MKLSIYLNRHVLVMYGKRQKSLDFSSCTCTVTQIFRPIFTASGQIHIGSCPVPLFNFAPSHLTLLLLNTTCPVLANSIDPDQLASEEANRSGSALFVIKYVNIYQKSGSSNQIGWKLEVGVAS